MVDLQILPVITFALLTGAAGVNLREQQRLRLMGALEIINDLMTTIVHLALRLAPFAVAALLISVILKLGLQFLQALAIFVIGVLAVMAVHLFGTMSLLLRLLSRRSPRAFFAAIRTVIVTAFSTSSSAATLPTTLQVSRETLGVSASTAGFVLPLGATMNMSGTALYEGCVVLFVAQVYGIPLSGTAQVTLLVLAVLSAVAVAVSARRIAAADRGAAGQLRIAPRRHRVDPGSGPPPGHGPHGVERDCRSGHGLHRGRADGGAPRSGAP